jgi:long-chain acyl-CoA synthetase
MDEPNLARQAERQLDLFGDYDTLFFEGSWHSSGTLARRAGRVAGGLAAHGVRPGDRVVVLMANCPEVLIAYQALWRAGAVVTPLIFLVSTDELRHALADSGAVAVLTTPEFAGKVAEALPGTGVRLLVVAGPAGTTAGQVASTVRVLPFAELEAADPARIADRRGDDLAALLYTGGTTGRSKGVPLSQANLMWCGWSATEAGDVRGQTSALVPLPLAHAYGLLVACMGLHRREPGQTVLMRWFDPAGWLDLARDHRVHRTALVPSMIQMLLALPLAEHDLSSLVAVASGAAPLAAEVREQFEARVPSAQIYEGYGCTESASLISSSPFGRRRAGSVGLPVPGCEVTVQDENGKELPTGEDGEICVRSPGVTAGYWRSPKASAVALAGGWLHTGDIGHLDGDGYLYVVDRKKDLIIRGGFNVYPRDVEDVLLAHPAVAMAAVVGRPDPRLGEEVVGFVSLRPGAQATGPDLVAHARAHLAANKYPREVHVLDAIPLTSVGKLDRKRLRAQVRAAADPAGDAATGGTATGGSAADAAAGAGRAGEQGGTGGDPVAGP